MKASLPLKKLKRASRGYTLTELAMLIGIIGIFASFALISYQSSGEMRDAAMVQSAQASLQTIVSQGAARMDIPPAQLVETNSANILNAVRASAQQNNGGDMGVTFTASAGGNFTMAITSSNRQATYTVQPNGDVFLTSLSPTFTKYMIRDGSIAKR